MAVKRIARAKLGDVFEVNLEDDNKVYFQFISLDITQLNSEVIRVFKEKYCQDEEPNLNEIVLGEIDFYVHVVIKAGILRNIWDKVGNVELEDGIDLPYFRSCRDYGNKEYHRKKSSNWMVWKTGEPFHFIGELSEKYKTFDIGMVFPPPSIHKLIKGERVPINYPL